MKCDRAAAAALATNHALRRAAIAAGCLLLGVSLAVLGLRSEAAPAADRVTDAARAALGKRLFADKALSRDRTVSCAGCHQSALAFTDGKPVATGFEGKLGTRNTMSLLNVGQQTSFFWDGRRTRLEDQVLDPLVNPLEHALADQGQVLSTLRANPEYRKAFAAAFPATRPDPVQTENLSIALAAFVRTLVSPESAIDRFVVKKDNAALSPDARAGFQVFTGKAQCVSCHSLKPDSASGRVLLTDQSFHAHGASFYGMHQSLDRMAKQVLAKGKPLSDVARDDPQGTAGLGRFMVSGALADVGAFRTPSLRNVAKTAPYFHDGRVTTLELAVEQELLSQGSEQRLLSPEEKRVLLVFLKALNDDTR